MATSDDVPEFDEMHSGSGSNSRRLDLEPGESYRGKLLFRFRFVGPNDSDVLVIDGSDGIVSFWCGNTVVRQLNNQNVDPECWIGLKKDSEETSFENDDGETISYYPVEVRSKEVGH